MTTNPNSLDFVDLMEYDEFDVYDEIQSRSLPIDDNRTIDMENSGVPLSVELSESMLNRSALPSTSQCTNQSDAIGDSISSSSSFVKGSELFLRIDGQNVDSAKSSEETPTTINVGIELQYENEFYDEDNVDGDNLQFNETSQSYHSMADNENEQLLLEGIFF